MKKLNVFSFVAASILAVSGLSTLASCGKGDEGEAETNPTALAVEDASKLSVEELVEKSKAEMTEGEVFKTIGLSSVMKAAIKKFAEKYDHITADETDASGKVTKKGNVSYEQLKDVALFQALSNSSTSYLADYALTQDMRSVYIALESNYLHNYVPSDYKALGLAEKDTYPLKTLYFNKVFYHSKDMADGDFTNVWQLACEPDHPRHIKNFSIQDPQNEKINMGFFLSIMNPDYEPVLKSSYKNFYGEDYAGTEKIGLHFIKGLINSVTVWHPSDTDAMKKDILKETGDLHNIYFGAFAKMKDACRDEDKNPHPEKIAWDFELDGFKGFSYAMFGSVINNAKHPYTAALFAREMLTSDMYETMCFNEKIKDKEGNPTINYGYYSPCIRDDIPLNNNDWTITKWNECSLEEDYEYLTNAQRANEVATIKTLCAASSAKRPEKK